MTPKRKHTIQTYGDMPAEISEFQVLRDTYDPERSYEKIDLTATEREQKDDRPTDVLDLIFDLKHNDK